MLFRVVKLAIPLNPIRQLVLSLFGLFALVIIGPVSVFSDNVPIAEGKATRYARGKMEQVVANRIKWGHIDPAVYHDGYVAVADCGLIGGRVYLQLPDGRISGPHLVADCGAAHDQQYLENIGFAVDLSYDLAKTLGVMDNVLDNVTVWSRESFQWKVFRGGDR